jgi:hypothetical protein
LLALAQLLLLMCPHLDIAQDRMKEKDGKIAVVERR